MLHDLRIARFRCFDSLRFEPEAGPTLLLGENAQGKTSLLEAICCLLRLQSPRTNQPADLVKHGSDGFSLEGDCDSVGLKFQWLDGRRSIFINGELQARGADYLQAGLVSWFSNEDIRIVRGSGGDRRRFLDFLGAQTEPGYLPTLRSYDRALRSRNFLLKAGRRREVEAYSEPLLENGQRLTALRAAVVRSLAPFAATACGRISGDVDRLEMRYQPGAGESFREQLLASQEEEQRLCQTVVGPHRDDIELLSNGQPAGRFASEGQQRTAAVALRVAQTEVIRERRDRWPIVLIDDVFGELQAARREALLELLRPVPQSIAATTHLSWAAPEESRIWILADKQLRRG